MAWTGFYTLIVMAFSIISATEQVGKLSYFMYMSLLILTYFKKK